ncbi:MAG: U32 family peptidase [Tissierellia bacterium]|nr:U32 family peptidase [Tissierellia bacterium]
MVELLAPAGDLERLKTACIYGADATYVGGISFGLRKGATNFNHDQLKEAVQFTHSLGKKLYVTMNIIPHDGDLTGLTEYIAFLDSIHVDAVIVSDPGIFMEVKQNSNLEIHISTQGSVTNAPTANFWHNLGASRIVLARELTLEEIRHIRRHTPDSLELEAFCHGAMCMSYSGRCLISSYMTGRDANRGDCAHPCRYKYHLMEEKRPGEYFPIEETEGGTYLMNSKDLKTISFVDQLIDAGIHSLKIEGRMKSSFYVATVLRAYRRAVDMYLKNPKTYVFEEEWDRELTMSSHRPFTDGFYHGNPKEDGQFPKDSASLSSAQYKADVLRVDREEQRMYISLKNGINEGDILEVIGPKYFTRTFTVEDLRDAEGLSVERANIPNSTYSFIYDGEDVEHSFIRKVVEK